jgi:hypothetical protein
VLWDWYAHCSSVLESLWFGSVRAGDSSASAVSAASRQRRCQSANEDVDGSVLRVLALFRSEYCTAHLPTPGECTACRPDVSGAASRAARQKASSLPSLITIRCPRVRVAQVDRERLLRGPTNRTHARWPRAISSSRASSSAVNARSTTLPQCATR